MERVCYNCHQKKDAKGMEQITNKNNELRWICFVCQAKRANKKAKKLTKGTRFFGEDRLGNYRVIKRLTCVGEVDWLALVKAWPAL